jgi:hypothetical protein
MRQWCTWCDSRSSCPSCRSPKVESLSRYSDRKKSEANSQERLNREARSKQEAEAYQQKKIDIETARKTKWKEQELEDKMDDLEGRLEQTTATSENARSEMPQSDSNVQNLLEPKRLSAKIKILGRIKQFGVMIVTWLVALVIFGNASMAMPTPKNHLAGFLIIFCGFGIFPILAAIFAWQKMEKHLTKPIVCEKQSTIEDKSKSDRVA